MTSHHVEARSRRGRKLLTFHGADAVTAAVKWDKERRLMDQLKGRITTEVTFYLVTTSEEVLNIHNSATGAKEGA